MNKLSVIFLLFATALVPVNLMAQDTIKPAKSFLKNTEISGQWFISGNYDDHDSLYQIELKRGYFTIESHLTENLTARYTQDITLDTEGDDAGNVEMRLKYLYLQQKIHFLPEFQQGSFSIGMVPRPWIEFEQKSTHTVSWAPCFSKKQMC